jgi:hypothetical protein
VVPKAPPQSDSHGQDVCCAGRPGQPGSRRGGFVCAIWQEMSPKRAPGGFVPALLQVLPGRRCPGGTRSHGDTGSNSTPEPEKRPDAELSQPGPQWVRSYLYAQKRRRSAPRMGLFAHIGAYFAASPSACPTPTFVGRQTASRHASATERRKRPSIRAQPGRGAMGSFLLRCTKTQPGRYTLGFVRAI